MVLTVGVVAAAEEVAFGAAPSVSATAYNSNYTYTSYSYVSISYNINSYNTYVSYTSYNNYHCKSRFKYNTNDWDKHYSSQYWK